MQLNDPDAMADPEDCRYALRILETEAYSAIINAFRAQGPFSQYYHLILEHLRIILNVSNDRHKAEIRRALADPTLLKLATSLNPQTDVTFEWTEEAKRTSGNASLPSVLAMESPAFYRFNFLRTSKNDLLLHLADRLAMLAVEHNRSKAVENGEARMFQALKKSKTTAAANREKKTVEIASPFLKPMDKPQALSMAEKKAASNATRPKVQATATLKRKSAQKDAILSPAANPIVLQATLTPATTSGTSRKQAGGRPRKQAMELPIPKQRLGQIIAARSAAAVGGRGASSFHQRGRGAKKFSTIPTKATLTAHTSPQRAIFGPLGQQPTYFHSPPNPVRPLYQQKTPPRTPPRQIPPLLSPSTPPVVNNQPGIGQKASSFGRQVRKRAFATGPVPTWPTVSGGAELKLPTSTLGSSRVPVSPLSMLPVSSSVTAKSSIGQSRFFAGPGSPTRPLLSAEAPGVYADDYNANAMDAPDSLGGHASPEAPMQPHQFFSSLSATYFAQTTPPPVKQRRFSPGPATSLIPSIAHGSRLTGITVKKSGSGESGAATAASSSDSGTGAVVAKQVPSSGGLGATLPVRQSTGQKLIVLPSAVLRRTQQGGNNSTTTTATTVSASLQKAASLQLGGKQQSLIIVRRAPSVPSGSTSASATTVVSTSTTPTATPSTTPAPATPSASTPSETQEEPPKGI